jgi:DNA-binding MarR family transcriptional regulator
MPTTRTVQPLSARDPRLAPWRAFVMAQAAVTRQLDAELRAEHGMSLQEYEALLALVESPDRRLRMGRLAEALHLSKSGVTRLVDRLASDGLVARVSCASDARGAEAELTTAGVDRLRTASKTHLRGIAEHFLSRIDEADLPVVERVLGGVAEGFEWVPTRTRGRG